MATKLQLHRVAWLVAAALGLVALTDPTPAQTVTPPTPPIVASPAPTPTAIPFPLEAPGEYAARMQWFDAARFGLFIHWGLYSVPAGQWNGKTHYSEWISEEAHIPMSQYEHFADGFNPTELNATRWVKMAKDAGMKYIVITSCHHEGFSMYPSKVSNWSLMRTSFRRDPLKELAVACKKQGLKLCFYHTIMDWHSSDYAPRRAWNDTATGTPDMDRYVTYLKAELKELLTNYGPIGILWFDGEWEDSWTQQRGYDLLKYVRSLQPNIIVNNRVGHGRGWIKGLNRPVLGDYGTPEQEIPPTGLGLGAHWESCMTMGGTWGYNKADTNWKSSQTLVRNLIDIASKGGNYLLNVGPTAQGVFPDRAVQRLHDIGAWMKINGESIYGTSASPFRRLAWGRATQKTTKGNTTLYLHVWDWPRDGKLHLPGLKNTVRSATLLQTQKSLATASDTDGVTIQLPTVAPDAISSTIVLKLHGLAQVEAPLPTQNPGGTLTLLPEDATITGEISLETGADNTPNFGYWTNPQDTLTWTFRATRAGKLELRTEIAALGDSALIITLGSQNLTVNTLSTGSYNTFKPQTLGALDIPAPGLYTLKIAPVAPNWHPLNLRAIQLRPAP